MRVELHDAWTVRAVGGDVPPEVSRGPVPATVPGTVHTDLLSAGLIPDPYLDENERALQWIGRADWRYETAFDWDAGSAEDRAELVCEGLDTVATVELNGAVVAETRNMHRTYRFDVREHLRAGRNELAVTFASAVRYADRASLELGARPHVNHHPFNAIRKMACNFGWDWGPDLVTAGIWKAIGIEAWSTARLAAVRPLVSVDGTRGTVAVHVDVERAGDAGPVTVSARVGDTTAEGTVDAGATNTVVEVVVDDVELWWPHGHGDQPLYDVTVTLGSETQQLDEWRGRVGFRSLRLDTVEDEHGTGFTFVVNDRPIFARGANWIPDDAFPHRVTRERYAERVAQSKEAGINLLRVWGGGIFEADDFYDVCDEQGVLTWQDFLFACAAYAEEEPMRGEVIAEARDNITRLVPHPSLVLWNGCNENIWGYFDWGWEPRLEGRTWGLGYYLDLLPALVAELDPTRPYSAGSPWSLSMDRHPNDPAHGTMHIWDVWNQVDYTVYRDYVPRFAAEFGWQGPPTWSTLTRAISDDPLTPESPGMFLHQKAEYGNRKLEAGLVPHLPLQNDMDDWHWAMSLNQARAVGFGLEHFRSWSPRCMGTVVWQINDCWPVTSWAAVDGDGRRKPLWYSMRHAYADRLVTVQPRDGGLAAVAVNDTDEPWQGSLGVSRRSYDGSALAEGALELDVPARGTVAVPLPADVAAADQPANEVVVVEGGPRRALWFFAEDRDSELATPEHDAECERVDGGYELRVTARSLLRDVAVLADKVAPDAVVDDMLVTVLPGETATFAIRTTADVDPAAFQEPRVLRCSNQLLRPAHPRG
ncbi:MAG: glycoside hydrolase family 2 protein [Actinomycetota bacterium]|nr:glycoside hydrolase family 2 protein [Actinomycetota bacterium]